MRFQFCHALLVKQTPSWTPEQVCQWLKEQGYNDDVYLLNSIINKRVDGTKLLELTHTEIVQLVEAGNNVERTTELVILILERQLRFVQELHLGSNLKKLYKKKRELREVIDGLEVKLALKQQRKERARAQEANESDEQKAGKLRIFTTAAHQIQQDDEKQNDTEPEAEAEPCREVELEEMIKDLKFELAGSKKQLHVHEKEVRRRITELDQREQGYMNTIGRLEAVKQNLLKHKRVLKEELEIKEEKLVSERRELARRVSQYEDYNEKLQSIYEVSDEKNKKLAELQIKSTRYQNQLSAQKTEFDARIAEMGQKHCDDRDVIRESEEERQRLYELKCSLENQVKWGIILMCIMIVSFVIFIWKQPAILTKEQMIEEYNLIEQERFDQITQQNVELFTETKSLQQQHEDELEKRGEIESNLKRLQEKLEIYVSPRQHNETVQAMNELTSERDEEISDLQVTNEELVTEAKVLYDRLEDELKQRGDIESELKWHLETLKNYVSPREHSTKVKTLAELISKRDDDLQGLAQVLAEKGKVIVDLQGQLFAHDHSVRDELWNEDPSLHATPNIMSNETIWQNKAINEDTFELSSTWKWNDFVSLILMSIGMVIGYWKGSKLLDFVVNWFVDLAIQQPVAQAPVVQPPLVQPLVVQPPLAQQPVAQPPVGQRLLQEPGREPEIRRIERKRRRRGPGVVVDFG